MIELTRWLPICMMRFGRARGLDHLRPIGVEVDHRLLAVNVLAGLHGIHWRLLVPVVGGADDDRVNVLARQNLVVVARGEDVVAPQFLAVRRGGRCSSRPRPPPSRPAPDRDLRIVLPLAARADQRDLDVVVGRDGLFGLSLLGVSIAPAVPARPSRATALPAWPVSLPSQPP